MKNIPMSQRLQTNSIPTHMLASVGGSSHSSGGGSVLSGDLPDPSEYRDPALMEGWLMTGPAQGSRELSHFHPEAAGQKTNTGSLPSAGPRGPAVCLGRKRTWSDRLRILAPGNLICTVSPPSCASLQIPSPGAATQGPDLASTAHEGFRWDDAQSGSVCASSLG